MIIAKEPTKCVLSDLYFEKIVSEKCNINMSSTSYCASKEKKERKNIWLIVEMKTQC